MKNILVASITAEILVEVYSDQYNNKLIEEVKVFSKSLDKSGPQVYSEFFSRSEIFSFSAAIIYFISVVGNGVSQECRDNNTPLPPLPVYVEQMKQEASTQFSEQDIEELTDTLANVIGETLISLDKISNQALLIAEQLVDTYGDQITNAVQQTLQELEDDTSEITVSDTFFEDANKIADFIIRLLIIIEKIKIINKKRQGSNEVESKRNLDLVELAKQLISGYEKLTSQQKERLNQLTQRIIDIINAINDR